MEQFQFQGASFTDEGARWDFHFAAPQIGTARGGTEAVGGTDAPVDAGKNGT